MSAGLSHSFAHLLRRTAPRSAAPLHGGWLSRDEVVMGTAIHVELWSERADEAQEAIDAVMAEMHRIDHGYSPVKPSSELSRINREAAHAAVPLSAEMHALLERALAFSRLTGGAFDITYASAGHLYDYRAGVAPDVNALEHARAAIGWQHLHLDPLAHTLRFGLPGMRIDLGGFAKGFAVDQAARILAEHGIAHAIVSAGGDSRVIGDRRGRPWSVAVRDPRREGEVVAVLPLQDVSISTSGDYERCFIDRQGQRHHHILDPRTGRSPRDLRSVTILADDGLTSEAMSKGVFVLGLERGMALVASVPGVDAIAVDAHGQLHYSSGLQSCKATSTGAQRAAVIPATT